MAHDAGGHAPPRDDEGGDDGAPTDVTAGRADTDDDITRTDDAPDASDDAGGGSGDDDVGAAPSTPTSGPRPPSNPGAVGEATWDPEECHVPIIEVPSAASEAMQWTLAWEYCETVEAHGCLDQALDGWYALADCSDEERLYACLQMVLESHDQSTCA